MFRDAIYLDGKMIRTIESNDDWQLLSSPYVYRTTRVIGGHIERPNEELQDLCNAFRSVFETAPELTAKQLDEAVVTTITRNHYLNRPANVEVRLYNRDGRAVLYVESGALLDEERYDAAVLRPSGRTLAGEITHTEHFTSVLKQTLAINRRSPRELLLLRQGGNIVSCEGFPLYGVVGEKIVAYTPWSSVESRRAEALFEKGNRELLRGVLSADNPSEPEELFAFMTNSLVSLSHIDSRPLVPFTAYSLGRSLQRL